MANAFWTSVLKSLEDKVAKPPIDGLIANLKANEATNIEALDAAVTAAGGNALPSVAAFFTNKIKAPNALVQGVEDLVIPEAEQLLQGALSSAEQTVPGLYAAGLAFLTKIDGEL